MRRSTLLLALTLVLAHSAQALVFVSGDGQGNTSAPADDPGWSHFGRIGGLGAIYLGNGWVLTANHVGVGDAEFQGVTYPHVPGSGVQLQNPDLSYADLAVFRIDPSPNLGLLELRTTTPANNTSVTYIARGVTRGAATSWSGNNGFLWTSNTGPRWGTNRVSGSGSTFNTFAFSTTFTSAPAGETHETSGANGDSGGAAFIKSGGVWYLAGVLYAIGAYEGQPPSTSLYGNVTWSADLSQYREQLIELTRPECANEIDDDGDSLIDWPADPDCASELELSERPDQDGDGIGDVFDNCLTVENADQRDTNQDGFGNICDTDYDDSGSAGLTDYGILLATYGRIAGDPLFNEDCDAYGDGGVGVADYGLLLDSFGSPPGPSGLACAGSPPCP
jgi:hypothetical protein